MDTSSTHRNWDYVDPKVLCAFDEISRYTQQLHSEEDHAAGKDFLVFKDKIKLQKSFQKARENMQSILDTQKNKMIDYFDNQLDYMSKRSVPSNDITNRSLNFHSLKRSTVGAFKPKTLTRNLSADDFTRYETERAIRPPTPTKNEPYDIGPISPERISTDFDTPNQFTPYSCSFEAEISIPDYLGKHRVKPRSTQRTRHTYRNSESESNAGVNTTYIRDSTLPRDSERTFIWNGYNEGQEVMELKTKISSLQAELEKKNQEIERLKDQSLNTTHSFKSSPVRDANGKRSKKLYTTQESLSFINMSTQESTTEFRTRDFYIPSIKVGLSRGAACKRRIREKVANWEQRKERKFKKLYMQSQQLMENYENTLESLRESFEDKRTLLENTIADKDNLQENLLRTKQAKDLITEKFAAFKEQMVGVLESVQQRLGAYNEKDQAYQGLLDENKTLKSKYEEMLVRYTHLASRR